MNGRMNAAEMIVAVDVRSSDSRHEDENEDATFVDMNAADILRELLRLSTEERAKIALELLKSLDGESEEGVEESWNAEIERRSAEVDAGTAEIISLEEHEALMDQKWATRAK
jgi:putative addiction module component (TIGR02574 family)